MKERQQRKEKRKTEMITYEGWERGKKGAWDERERKEEKVKEKDKGMGMFLMILEWKRRGREVLYGACERRVKYRRKEKSRESRGKRRKQRRKRRKGMILDIREEEQMCYAERGKEQMREKSKIQERRETHRCYGDSVEENTR